MVVPAPNFAMNPLIPLLFLLGFGTFTVPLLAQEPSPKAASTPAVVPPDINGYKTIITPPVAAKPVKVLLYNGGGVSKDGVEKVRSAVAAMPGSVATLASPEEMATLDLKAYDVVVFCGGVARSQAKALGEAGMSNVREYVRNGGGYVGICAGAYLACTGFDWSLGILNASTVSSKWRRGIGYMDAEVVEKGQALFGEVKGNFKVRYHNGPVIKPGTHLEIPAYTPVILFRSEIAEHGSPAGVMVNSPASAMGTFEKGRVFVSSPHPENTPGLEHLIPRAILWAAGQEPQSAGRDVVP